MSGQAVDLSSVLLQAQAIGEVRIQAESQLNQFQEQDFQGYTISLVNELASEQKEANNRVLAGILLKNSLDSKESLKKDEQVERWLALDTNFRHQIKNMLLETLNSQIAQAARASASVIAKIASIELRQKQWPELVQTLLNNVQNAGSQSLLKQATLETFGYVCEELGGDEVLEQDEVNKVLTAVVQGMQREEPDMNIRLAATMALFNALEFAHVNFENQNERNYLMQVICEGTQSPEQKIRVASFECLVRIGMEYYDHIRSYMTGLFNITVKAAKEEPEEVALQALEFWCTIAEEELEIQDMINEESEEQYPKPTYHNLINTASTGLTPVLLELMTRQEEEQELDDESWTLAMQAATCLTLVANVVGQPILQQVMPFIQENITKNSAPEDWHFREAATLAFGCILEGPTEKEVLPIVEMGLPHFLTALKDASEQVRSTTAWTIGRIFDILHYPDSAVQVVSSNNVSSIMDALIGALGDSINLEQNIAEKVCFAISCLAAGYPRSSPSTDLSQHFQKTVEALLHVTNQPHVLGNKLHMAAYESLNEVIRHCGNDCLTLVSEMVNIVLARLANTMSMEKSEAVQEIQGQCCGVLQVSMQRLTSGDSQTTEQVKMLADDIMQGLLQVLGSRADSVNEEAMLAVGAMTYVQQGNFLRYMEKLWPFVETGIRNHMEWQTCKATVGVLSDIIRVLEDKFQPWADPAMQLLLANLQSQSVNRYVKPTILNTFGDMANALGNAFTRYLGSVQTVLTGAMQLSAEQSSRVDEELVAFNNELRLAILEASSGILMGLSIDVTTSQLAQYCQHLINFVGVINQYSDADDAVQKAAVEVLGDAAQKVAGCAGYIKQQPWVNPFFQQCVNHEDTFIRRSADYAFKAISQGST